MSVLFKSHHSLIDVRGKRVEVRHVQVDGAQDSILLLHEALGSASYWRDFPEKLARATHSNVLCYSRPGHGQSEGPLERRDEAHYRQQVELVIPTLLGYFEIEEPILYGHSEGAAIAVLYAAHFGSVEALILESPFVVPERKSYHHIRQLAASYAGSRLQQRLALYHRDADAVFHSWVNWAITISSLNYSSDRLLSKITCPVLALQGANDEFGTTVHLQALHASIPYLDFELFADTGHLPHRERTDHVLARVAEFLRRGGPSTHSAPPPPPSTRIEEQP
jgi:pimeloyl-ACP methyl ester carboxylesterase